MSRTIVRAPSTRILQCSWNCAAIFVEGNGTTYDVCAYYSLQCVS